MSELLGNQYGTPEKVEQPENTFKTDVEGVFADGSIKHGVDEYPEFKVSKDEFFNNMHSERKRLRFKSGTQVASYLQGTKYKRPFFVSFTDDNGKTFRRRIK